MELPNQCAKEDIYKDLDRQLWPRLPAITIHYKLELNSISQVNQWQLFLYIPLVEVGDGSHEQGCYQLSEGNQNKLIHPLFHHLLDHGVHHRKHDIHCQHCED